MDVVKQEAEEAAPEAGAPMGQSALELYNAAYLLDYDRVVGRGFSEAERLRLLEHAWELTLDVRGAVVRELDALRSGMGERSEWEGGA